MGAVLVHRGSLLRTSLLLTFISILCISCYRKGLEIKDGGLLSGEPCGPPCFIGIIPGVTTEEQVYQIIKNQNLNALCEKDDKVARGGERGITCSNIFIVTFANKSNLVNGLGYTILEIITARRAGR